MKKISLFATAALIGGCLFFSFSCNKATVDSNTQTATDVTLCQNEFMRIVPYLQGIMISNDSAKGIARIGSVKYPIISKTDTNFPWPKTLTINYGPPPGVGDLDGKTRSGIITFTTDEYWHDYFAGAVVNFSNYYVNGNSFSGSLQITRTSATTFKVTGSGLCITSGQTILYNAGYWIYTLASSVKDLNPADVVFTITGNGSGTDRNQVKFTYSTTSPLTKDNNCPYVSSGGIVIQPSGLATRNVTFANGCAASATVIIDGQNYNISM